jgi:hypothetical protein
VNQLFLELNRVVCIQTWVYPQHISPRMDQSRNFKTERTQNSQAHTNLQPKNWEKRRLCCSPALQLSELVVNRIVACSISLDMISRSLEVEEPFAQKRPRLCPPCSARDRAPALISSERIRRNCWLAMARQNSYKPLQNGLGTPGLSTILLPRSSIGCGILSNIESHRTTTKVFCMESLLD